jgi:hypothetical protein
MQYIHNKKTAGIITGLSAHYQKLVSDILMSHCHLAGVHIKYSALDISMKQDMIMLLKQTHHFYEFICQSFLCPALCVADTDILLKI